ncbi:VOC family protein [Egicoccus sp. AB-alg2]|uniref:VOC family protein n=1 Tax=Egicoccus sp. AB-alg2 TaxID=3242693 RepID=UPI00359DD6B5
MSLRLRNVQADAPAAAHDAVVAFWAAALGAASTRRASEHHTHLVGHDAVCGLHVQRREDGVSRFHLDLDTDDVAGEVQRLLAAGATHVASRPQGDGDVLASPAGLVLCVVETGRIEPELGTPGHGPARLAAVFVDVPAGLVDAEVGFWTAAFEVDARVATERDEYVLLGDVPGVSGPVRFEVQRLDDGAPRYHVDLDATDVTDAAARLQAAGAAHVQDVDSWVTLADPAGLLLCVVPDHFHASDDPESAP